MFRCIGRVPQGLRTFTAIAPIRNKLANLPAKCFVFDIDGVILRGRTAIPRAKETFQFLENNKIPFCLLTNGGGYREADRLRVVYETIGFKPTGHELYQNQIILSHTPYKEYVKDFKKILVVGPRHTTKQVALEYGFKEVYDVEDIVRHNSSIAPFSALASNKILSPITPKETLDHAGIEKTPFDAIFALSDPRDWGADIQIIGDLLNSDRGYLNTHKKEKINGEPSIPIFWSQKDLYWSNQYPLKRYGMGMFREVIRNVYQIDNNGLELKDTVFGKPMNIAYDYATKLLPKATPGTTEDKKRSHIYMVGDNPASDIIGAYNYGWNTCLVKTGVYQPGDPLPCKPTHIVSDLYEAVMTSLKD